MWESEDSCDVGITFDKYLHMAARHYLERTRGQHRNVTPVNVYPSFYLLKDVRREAFPVKFAAIPHTCF